MPMDRTQMRAALRKLEMTNWRRHLRQADKAAARAGATVAGVVLIFSHAGEDEVHFFSVRWIDEDTGKEIRKAVHGQLAEMISLEEGKNLPCVPTEPNPTRT